MSLQIETIFVLLQISVTTEISVQMLRGNLNRCRPDFGHKRQGLSMPLQVVSSCRCLRGGSNESNVPFFSSAETQQQLDDEEEALKAIYGDDMSIVRYPSSADQLARTEFVMKISKGLRLRLVCTPAYPSEVPDIHLDHIETNPAAKTSGKASRSASELKSHLAPIFASLRNNPMILDIITSAQEWAASPPADLAPDSSTPDSHQADSSNEERDSLFERKMHVLDNSVDENQEGGSGSGGGSGIPVTRESFAQLRALILEEQAAAAAHQEQTVHASPLTGREIWQRRLREGGDESDEEGDSAQDGGGVVLDASESCDATAPGGLDADDVGEGSEAAG